MSQKKSVYICQNCGSKHLKWGGQCSQCKEWNTLVEEIERKNKSSVRHASPCPTVLTPLTHQEPLNRTKTGSEEWDRVLGGGLVSGSYILLGGHPGVGKSTLLLQISDGLSRSGTVMYVCSEESVHQTTLRAQRLKISNNNILLFNESSIETILDKAHKTKPQFLIVDSIQSVHSLELESAIGTVSQVRECSQLLMNFAKSTSTPVFVIGHVTKDGSLAGPKVLEHMVDVVLSFDGHTQYRILKSLKNRFGATNEFGVFQMTDGGLEEIKNPSEFFLEERGKNRIGSSVFTAIEGQRPLLCEIQALTLSSFLSMPRRTSIGMDIQRLHMILAILEKYFQIQLSKYDIFVNLVGGLKVTETASDLAVVTALLSSYYKKPLDPNTAFFGEVGLTGEIRSCHFANERIQEAKKIGFNTVYLPYGNKIKKSFKIQVKGIKNILELQQIFQDS